MARRQPKLRGYGQSRGDRFVRLEFYMLDSMAWQALSPQATKLYIDLCKRYNGANNGSLAYSVREAEAIGLTRSTAQRAFAELQAHGFLAVARDASFNLKTRMARLWRLTAYPAFGRDPTKDFMGWKPPASAKTKHSPTRGTDSPTSGTVSPKILT